MEIELYLAHPTGNYFERIRGTVR